MTDAMMGELTLEQCQILADLAQRYGTTLLINVLSARYPNPDWTDEEKAEHETWWRSYSIRGIACSMTLVAFGGSINAAIASGELSVDEG